MKKLDLTSLKKALTSLQKAIERYMDENLRMKKCETASSNDLKPVMNCVGRCLAGNCSNGFLVQIRLQTLISRLMREEFCHEKMLFFSL